MFPFVIPFMTLKFLNVVEANANKASPLGNQLTSELAVGLI